VGGVGGYYFAGWLKMGGIAFGALFVGGVEK